MRTKQPNDELARQLKTGIAKTRLSMLKVAEQTGLRYQTVHGFIKYERDIQLSTASKLAAWLGLELRPVKGKSQRPGKLQKTMQKDRGST